MGSSIQPPGDNITVAADKFSVLSENYMVDYMYSRPDSFLLGTFYNQTFGTVHADILAQVEHPKNHIYPPNTTPDSILLVMYYKRFFGDEYSPMNVSVYEMNKKTFNYSTAYPSNINPDEYVDTNDPALLIGEKTFTAVDAITNQAPNFVVIKLSEDFLQGFSNVQSNTYTADSLFFDFFKGLYITTDFGSASMLYVRQIDLEYYHSYSYAVKDSNGQDSTVTISNSITFPANSWVRQVNRFMHPDKTSIFNDLENATDQIHHISSPANIYTRVQIPFEEMDSRINTNDSKVFLNDVKLKVYIDELPSTAYSLSPPSSLLLIKEDAIDRFFANRELPADTVAVLGSVLDEKNATSGEINYYYSFDLARLLAHEFKKAAQGEILDKNFVLVPVQLKLNNNNAVTDVSQQFLLYGVEVCGGNHSQKPMKINVVYSKF